MKRILFILSLLMCSHAWPSAEVMAHDFSPMENMSEQHFVDSNSSASCQIKKSKMWSAQTHFNLAVLKLIDVNNWSELIGIPGQEFDLYSGKKRVSRLAQEGDLIRIKLPLDPTMRSYWVRIESLKRNNQNFEDEILMIVRPTANPFKGRTDSNITDHFFTNEATNAFSVSLTKGKIKSSVSGRNEQANQTQVTGHVDAAANYTIVQSGWGFKMNDEQIGFQSLLWAKFNKAIATCD